MKQVMELEGIVSRGLIERLARQVGRDMPLVSLFVPVPSAASETASGRAARQTREQFDDWHNVADMLEISESARKAIGKLLDRALDETLERVGRRFVKGIAFFGDPSSQDLWVVPVDWGFPAMAFFEERFVLFPLELLLSQWERWAICLTDKDDARIFLYSQHQIEEVTTIIDEIPGKIRFPDAFRELQYMRKHVQYFHRHFARVAEALLRLYQREPFDGLIIGVPEELGRQFRSHLHAYVADRLIAEWTTSVDVPTHDLLQSVIEFEQHRLEDAAQKLRQRIDDAPPDRRAMGTDAVLKALWEGRLSEVWMPRDYAVAGSICRECSRITVPAKSECPECGAAMEQSDDVGFELLQGAVAQGARIRMYEPSKPALEPPVAALLRF